MKTLRELGRFKRTHEETANKILEKKLIKRKQNKDRKIRKENKYGGEEKRTKRKREKIKGGEKKRKKK